MVEIFFWIRKIHPAVKYFHQFYIENEQVTLIAYNGGISVATDY